MAPLKSTGIEPLNSATIPQSVSPTPSKTHEPGDEKPENQTTVIALEVEDGQESGSDSDSLVAEGGSEVSDSEHDYEKSDESGSETDPTLPGMDPDDSEEETSSSIASDELITRQDMLISETVTQGDLRIKNPDVPDISDVPDVPGVPDDDNLVTDLLTVALRNVKFECPFHFQGCQIKKDDVNAWILDTFGHFNGKMPPCQAICIFCPQEFVHSNGWECWRQKLLHIARHMLEDPSLKITDSMPDYALFRSLRENGWKEHCYKDLLKDAVPAGAGEPIYCDPKPVITRKPEILTNPPVYVPVKERRQEYRLRRKQLQKRS